MTPFPTITKYLNKGYHDKVGPWDPRKVRRFERNTVLIGYESYEGLRKHELVKEKWEFRDSSQNFTEVDEYQEDTREKIRINKTHSENARINPYSTIFCDQKNIKE